MKTWTLRFRAVDKKNFDTLLDGRKTIETRAVTPRWRAIVPGDILKITCAGEIVELSVHKVALFPSIEKLFEAEPLKTVMPLSKTLEDAKKEYYSYPGYREKIAKHGLAAFYLSSPHNNKEE